MVLAELLEILTFLTSLERLSIYILCNILKCSLFCYCLEGTRHKLYSLLRRSICSCPLCTNDDRDMEYIDLHDEWYCIECQDNDRIWYPAHGSEENRRQHDYINYYYEHKEKFEKIFHIRFLIRRLIRFISNRNI